MKATLGIVLTAISTASTACRSATRSESSQRSGVATVSSGAHVIPARVTGDRFFGTPVMRNGDTLVLFLDTGGGTLIWEPTVARYKIPIVDSVVARGGGYVKLVDVPAFKPDRSVPPVIASNRLGARLAVRSTGTGFESMIVRSSLGQLGATWFGDRVWTLDYLHRRLLMHDVAPPSGPTSHRTNLGFQKDTAGRRVSHSPAIGIAIDGDSLSMILDTGATVWLTPDALARIGDTQPAERGTSLIWPPVFEKWRARHPDWRVIESADVLTKQPMIEVPVVSIGGYDVGPVWFMEYANGGNPSPEPTYPPGTPTINKRISGTIGGSTLRFFSIVLDYPNATAEFSRPATR